ncbi:MAG: hypothetical protein U9N49_04520 [Campylobacterota bacterium]|nr:hypothetical protein [Campylobacterota bacterium]
MQLKNKIKILVTLFVVAFIALIIYKTNKSSSTKDSVIVQFIDDINPQLKNKMDQIEAQITIAKQKIAQIKELAQLYPRYDTITQKALKKWKALHTKLLKTKKEIYQQTEKSYIIYKINQIEGNKDFKTQSKELLIQANKALENAKEVQKSIEKSLYSTKNKK